MIFWWPLEVDGASELVMVVRVRRVVDEKNRMRMMVIRRQGIVVFFF